MKTYIVITSIFEPTEAVIKFSQLSNYKLIVVGDKKTPIDWEFKNVSYISIDKQIQSNYQLSKVLPFNH
jgi:hypothetical protein